MQTSSGPALPPRSNTLKKKLVVCCDGTWMNSDQGLKNADALNTNRDNPVLQTPTNVTRLSRCVSQKDAQGNLQITYYQSGMATQDILDKYVSGMTGLGLGENIREAYHFLTSNYDKKAGDEIVLVGFSRGSFTARSIAAFINAVGLITPKGMKHFYPIFEDWENQIKLGYKSHFPKLPFEGVNGTRPNLNTNAKEYVAKLVEVGFTVPDVKIKAVAVYDTVGSLGIPRIGVFDTNPAERSLDYAFVDTTVPNNVEHAIHALALDEERKPFAPTIWELPNPQPGQTLVQCWFAGGHGDVGGSFDDTRNSDITLAWMCQQLSPYLTFDMDVLKEQFHKAMPGPGEPRQYGCGQIHDVMDWKTWLGGREHRTPGAYNFYDHMTGREQIPIKPLVNTCEYMHSSIRIRRGLPGMAMNDKDNYDPLTLLHWTCKGTSTTPVPAGGPIDLASINKGQQNIVWVNDKNPSKTIPEAPLGELEYQLLSSILPNISNRFLCINPMQSSSTTRATHELESLAIKTGSAIADFLHKK